MFNIMVVDDDKNTQRPPQADGGILPAVTEYRARAGGREE